MYIHITQHVGSLNTKITVDQIHVKDTEVPNQFNVVIYTYSTFGKK